MKSFPFLFSQIVDALRPRFAYDGYSRQGRRGLPISGCSGRLLIALAVAAFAAFQYFSQPKEMNKFTGREQRLGNMTPQEEIQMGLASVRKIKSMYGEESRDDEARARVHRVGQKLVTDTDADETEYQFHFHLLADRETVNAFALPGGHIFITEALYRLLSQTGDDELAGVLAHEIGHVVGRHSAEQIAASKFYNGLTMAAVLATSDGQGGSSAQLAQLINQLATMKFSRSDEIESDKLGVKFLIQSGYRPEALIRVMEVLRDASGGGGGGSDFMSTHPSPDNRIGLIKEEIFRQREQGVK